MYGPMAFEFHLFQKPAESENGKVIITNGKTPFLVEGMGSD